jgi:hypothetical protein
VSEESSTGAPGTVPVLSPEASTRTRPPWRRRGPVIAGLAAVILAAAAGIVLAVRNADVWLNYSTGAVGTPAQETPPPPIAEQVAATIALARDVLATLAR